LFMAKYLTVALLQLPQIVLKGKDFG
jgi:hypothetical protein